jgi:hypothetical protein
MIPGDSTLARARTLRVGGLRLVPANMLNPYGLLSFWRSTYTWQLQAWVARCGITDEAGRRQTLARARTALRQVRNHWRALHLRQGRRGR